MKIFCWQFVIFSLLWFSPHGNVENSSPCSGKKVNIKALKSPWNSNSNLWNQNSHEFVKSKFSGFQISNPSLPPPMPSEIPSRILFKLRLVWSWQKSFESVENHIVFLFLFRLYPKTLRLWYGWLIGSGDDLLRFNV